MSTAPFNSLFGVFGSVVFVFFLKSSLTEHDIEPLRIYYYGNDIYSWYLLVSYLLLSLDHPNDVLSIEFVPLCIYILPFSL